MIESPGVARRPLRALIDLARPRHWIKNAFVLAPLVFAGSFLDPRAIALALAATALFCLASSAVYVLNDLLDVEKDRRHPVKRLTRPLAAGWLKPRTAWLFWGLLQLVLLSAWALPLSAALAIDLYLLLNAAYSLKLKQVPVVDVFCVSSGFVLRVCAGAWAIQVPVSSWILVTTLCLGLYLATLKRHQELASNGDAGRAVLGAYTPALLERYAQLSATSTIVFYGLFITTVRPALAVTIPLVLFGLFRYWYLVEACGEGESPTDLLWRDIPLIVTVLAWGSLSLLAIALQAHPELFKLP
jgi:4-hydroxybenzoate polyprenyltransferase